MSSNPPSVAIKATGAARPASPHRSRLAAILPFDSTVVRYALAAWLLLSVCTCIAAFAYSKPRSRAALLAAHHLFDLESQFESLNLNSQAHNLVELRSRSARTREAVFKDQLSIDQRVAEIVISLRSKGWKGSVVDRGTQEDRINDLNRFTYHLELEKLVVGQGLSASATHAPNPSAELLELLRAVGFDDARIDIDRLHVSAPHARLPKIQISLSALATR